MIVASPKPARAEAGTEFGLRSTAAAFQGQSLPWLSFLFLAVIRCDARLPPSLCVGGQGISFGGTNAQGFASSSDARRSRAGRRGRAAATGAGSDSTPPGHRSRTGIPCAENHRLQAEIDPRRSRASCASCEVPGRRHPRASAGAGESAGDSDRARRNESAERPGDGAGERRVWRSLEATARCHRGERSRPTDSSSSRA